jgi:hypothetical protein
LDRNTLTTSPAPAAFGQAAAVIGGFPYVKSGNASDTHLNLNARYSIFIEISETKGFPYVAFFTLQTNSIGRGRLNGASNIARCGGHVHSGISFNTAGQ